jgi:hypothetical protein
MVVMLFALKRKREMRTKAQDEVKKQPFLRHAQQCNAPAPLASCFS